MKKILWDESYSVGVREMDQQHKTLIDMINTLIEADQLRVDSEMVSDVLMKMTQYASMHFRKEEELLQKYEYPGYESQRRQHTEYRRKVITLCMETMDKKADVPQELLQYLVEWWTRHILVEDKEYGPFLNEKGVT